MKRYKWHAVLMMIMMCFFNACASTKVSRLSVGEKMDLSGGWNDNDAMFTAQEMIKDCLAKPWLNAFMEEKGHKPTVIIGHVANRSHEHINVQVITKYLEKELLNAGQVIFVASAEEREGLREEREDQQKGYTQQETIAEKGRERGADFMLIGSFNSIVDTAEQQTLVLSSKRQSAIFYQVNLELIRLTTNEKVWIGQKEIKKLVEQSKFGL